MVSRPVTPSEPTTEDVDNLGVAHSLPGKYKCPYCDYSGENNSKVKKHKVACKKKLRNKCRATSVPRNKEALTLNLAGGDTREFVDYESGPGSSSKLCLEKQKLLKRETM